MYPARFSFFHNSGQETQQRRRRAIFMSQTALHARESVQQRHCFSSFIISTRNLAGTNTDKPASHTPHPKTHEIAVQTNHWDSQQPSSVSRPVKSDQPHPSTPTARTDPHRQLVPLARLVSLSWWRQRRERQQSRIDVLDNERVIAEGMRRRLNGIPPIRIGFRYEPGPRWEGHCRNRG